MNESSLDHLRLLGCGCGPDGRVWGIARVPRFGAIGIDSPVAIGATVNGHNACWPRRRGCDLHCAGVVRRGWKNREISSLTANVWSSGEGVPGGWRIG